MKPIIKQVFLIKYTNQKMITIPKNCGIEAGDYVLIEKVEVKRNG